ncbi:CHAT domain-containing protein [Mycena galopus ATCC 62051]|nr:CHAT domain-containing protein [Mycena galopus ATCC 62051]
MPRIIHLHDIEIRSLSPLHRDLPADMRIFGQLIVDKHIILQTVPLDPEASQNSWTLKPECKIPEHALTFLLAIMRHSKTQGTRLLGSIKIARGEALASGGNNIPLCLDLVKVNLDGPTLKLTVNLSVSESLSIQHRQPGVKITGNRITSLADDWLVLVNWLQQMKDDAKQGIQADIQELWRSRFLKVLGDISLEQWKTSDMIDPLDHHPDRPSWLANLGASLLTRFQRFGELSDLDESISKQEEAVLLIRNGHSDRSGALNNLGISLQTRFERVGDPSDLKECISKLEEAVLLTPVGHPDRPSRLSNLGGSLWTSFQQIGDLSTLNRSISKQGEAITLIPDDHPDKPSYLNNLGISLWTRFGEVGDLNNLNECISQAEEAALLTPSGHPDRPYRLNILGVFLLDRFERLGDLHDLKESLSKKEEGLLLTPDDHPDRPGRLSSEEALLLTPEGHSDRPTRLNNLGISLRLRFEQLGDYASLNECISKQEQAVLLTPVAHPDRSRRLNNLGNSWQSRYEQSHSLDDLQKTILQFASAACSPTGSAHVRFQAATMWASNASIMQHSSVLEAYDKALNILPEVAWLGLSINDRYHQITRAGSVVRDAAAAAISSGQPGKAVEWLEQGRSIIWGQLLNLRTPVDDLRQKYPQLADELIFLSTQLAGATTRKNDSKLSTSADQHSLQSIGQQAHVNAQKRDALVKKIRELDGFEQFLSPKTISELMPAAQKGPVVLLNVGQASCDALVLHFSNGVTHVPLPEFTLRQAEALTKSLNYLMPYMGRGDIDRLQGNRVGGSGDLEDDFAHILSELWVRLVKPVLDGLAITIPSNHHLPRIWWCPTGPLTSLPIHAAGIYGKEAAFGSKLSDFHGLQLLAVAQPSAAGQSYIPGTRDEINQIQHCAKDKISVCSLVEHEATVARVEDEMINSSWVHFACHGVQDIYTPTESALLLSGSSQLTLSRIIELSLPHADLAFLSACQTATGDKKLQEESVHLAAGMLLAGYRGVIATMWSIMDNDAPQVAKAVYEHLFKSTPPDPTQAAEALHLAIQNLREGSGGTKSFFHWVPFIHVGV